MLEFNPNDVNIPVGHFIDGRWLPVRATRFQSVLIEFAA